MTAQAAGNDGQRMLRARRISIALYKPATDSQAIGWRTNRRRTSSHKSTIGTPSTQSLDICSNDQDPYIRRMRIGRRVRELLQTHTPYDDIVAETGCSKPTISYHARKLGIPKHAMSVVYDWVAVQADIDSGRSFTECRERFGFSAGAWFEAKSTSKIKYKSRRPFLIAGSRRGLQCAIGWRRSLRLRRDNALNVNEGGGWARKFHCSSTI